MNRLCLPFLALMILLPLRAMASHYDLASIDLVTEAEMGRLQKLGIRTTEELYNATRSNKRLVRFARKMKVQQGQARDWRDFCDVLHVRGAGPKVVRILRYAGVRKLSQLASRNPERLAERIRSENKKRAVLGKLPPVELVGDWIDQAKDLVRKRKKRR